MTLSVSSMPSGVPWRGKHKYVVSAWVVLVSHIIAENDLGAGIIAISPVAQELCHIFDILMAATQFMLATRVVDANEERLPAGHAG